MRRLKNSIVVPALISLHD
uniref:Uncharacterized protein n=1 Tax=Lepeophtheirus salmonis TaxID=72036 RepID=A0A0K2TLJ0_LEPSM